MASVNVVNTDNKKAGSIELDPAVFEAVVSDHVLHDEVRRQLSRRRAGTASTKNRARVSGGGAKPWRQKGTGRARQGTNRAPQWAGGGSVFGPVPRSYEHKLPKKVRRAALRGALTQRHKEGALIVVDELDLDEFKTSRMVALLDSLGLAGASVLLVIAEPNAEVEISARNLPHVGVIRAPGLNVYDVLRSQKLVMTKDAVAEVEARLSVEKRVSAEAAS
jgi:large subunit ribosomal protein L4